MSDRDQFYNDNAYFYADRFKWKKGITKLNSFTNEYIRAQQRILVFRKFLFDY